MKMMDYYEPMTVIHMTDDLQLVMKTKKKKVTFSPDVDKHIILIQGSDSVPMNLISESETYLATVDTDIVTEGHYDLNFTLPSGEETVKPSISFFPQRYMMVELGMLEAVVPLPEIGKEVDLEMHKVVASTKKKMFPDVDWKKSPSLLFSDVSGLSETESVTPTSAKRPDTGDGAVQTKRCKLFHLSDTDDDTHCAQSADTIFLNNDKDEYFVEDSLKVTGAGKAVGSMMVVPESPGYLTESKLSSLCVKIKEYKDNQINMRIEERVCSAIYNVQHKNFIGRYNLFYIMYFCFQ